ncbi:hypothetical protein Bbelb_242320 [Branchiostoma belcheri]|nr:hypothetical protein Bbelb_242320 [Branchiostoma belcheri]
MAQLLKEFDEYQLNILGISEMRWTGSGKLCNEGKTVLFSGHEDQHRRGVGLILDKEASRALTGWKPVSDRIITARFQSRHGRTTIVQVYAPTDDAEESIKDQFYELLQDTFDNGSVNNEIDYICISQRWKSALLDVRVYRGADVGSDHHLLGAKMRLRLKKLTVKKKQKPFATDKLKDPTSSEKYRIKLQNRFQLLQEMGPDLEDQWSFFRETLTQSAVETIGRRRGSRKEQWIKEDTWKLIDERKKMKGERDRARSAEKKEETRNLYRDLDRQVKKSCRTDKREWLEKKSSEAEEAAKKNDARTLYRIVRELTGTWNSSSVPVKDKSGKTLLTTEEQDLRWMEHFQETLNQPNPDTLFDFATEEPAETLEVCEEPIRREETAEAIKALKNNKAAGLDEISAEMLKHGGESTVEMLTRLMNRCWQEGQVPRDWQDGVIVKLPKKGDLSDCNNWRGITLLSIPGKVFCAVLLRRLKKAVDSKLREEQAGFRSNRSCTEQIFTLRNIIDQCLEHQTPLVLNFIDFKKAFGSIHRASLWDIAASYGIPEQFVNAFKSLYANSRCCVRTEGGTTDFFDIVTGVRQGCILSPFLFLLTIDFVLRKTTEDGREGVRWREGEKLADLDFADDLALLSENNQDLQHLTTKLEQFAGKVGLRISIEKTKTMEVGDRADQPRLTISVYNTQVETVDQFTYLGSVLSNSGEVEPDISCRLGKAAAVFRRMRTIWATSAIDLDTKLRMNLRGILKVRWQDHITNEEILRRAKTQPLGDIITGKRMQLAGHILRLSSQRHSKTAMTWVPPGGRRKRGRPKNTWRRTFQEDLKRANIAWEEAEEAAATRTRWKLAAQCACRHRRT